MIEVMAVVVLLGLIAASAAWFMTEQVQRGSRDSAVGQLAYADRMARLAAATRGHRCVLRFDLDEQVVTRHERHPRSRWQQAHGVRLPLRCRIDAIITSAPGEISDGAGPIRRDKGTVEIAYSSAGRSTSYALRLVSHRDAVWVIVSGLTGQVTVSEHDQQIHNLFAMLATGRPDAD
jgi:type II secretory pathway pseudopilin PulG